MWLTLVLPVTFSEPIALEIVAGTGSYLGTQLFTGFMYIAGGLCLVLLRGLVSTLPNDKYPCRTHADIAILPYRWKIGELEEVERMKEEGDSDVEEIAAESPKRAIEAGRKTLFKYFWTWRIV